MKFAFIIGSHRVESESARIAAYLQQRLAALIPASSAYVLDLGKNPLPMWDEGAWGKPSAVDWQSVWSPISAELSSADALVALAPEYAGMVPAALKNFFLLAADGSLSHKPGLMIGVSAARGGAYPIAELRASSYKNLQLNWVPEHLIVRDAPKMLVGVEPANDDDKYLRARADYALQVLTEYAKALKSVRESGVINRKAYPFGM